MSLFPLYDQLTDMLDPALKELTDAELEEITNEIKRMTVKEHELIFAIIRTYQFRTQTQTYIIPYGGRRLKSGGIKFEMENFPLTLQHLILKFLEIHKKSKQKKLDVL